MSSGKSSFVSVKTLIWKGTIELMFLSVKNRNQLVALHPLSQLPHSRSRAFMKVLKLSIFEKMTIKRKWQTLKIKAYSNFGCWQWKLRTLKMKTFSIVVFWKNNSFKTVPLLQLLDLKHPYNCRTILEHSPCWRRSQGPARRACASPGRQFERHW